MTEGLYVRQIVCEGCGVTFEGSRRRRFCTQVCSHRTGQAIRRGGGSARPQRWFNHDITRVDVAWLAGLLEGEGNFRAAVVHKHEREYAYPQVSVTMTDADVLLKARDVTGLGSVCGPYRSPSRARHKPTFSWHVSRRDEALTVMAMVWPHLGVRRQQQIRDALLTWRACG